MGSQIDICMYLFITERDDVFMKPFGSIFLVRNDFVMKLLLFSLFSRFWLEKTCCLHVFHL